jgi:hypothetical protein
MGLTKEQRIENTRQYYQIMKKNNGFLFSYKHDIQERICIEEENALAAIDKSYKEEGNKRRRIDVTVELDNGEKYEVIMRGNQMRIVAVKIPKVIEPNIIKELVINKAMKINSKVSDIFIYKLDWDYSKVPLQV